MERERIVPVFIINGFLESGKTTFIINAILRDPNIQKERVLIISCEEGETEFESLPANFKIFNIEDKEELSGTLFERLKKEYRPSYVIIEYNSIWGMQALYDTKLNDGWAIAQQITIIDATTFESYFSNMKSIFADMLRGSDRVFMNRCNRNDNFSFYRNSIKSCSPRADIAYVSDEEGILDILLEDDLPYDINADIISINNDSYLTWYIDSLDNDERYEGKTVEYTGVALRPEYIRSGYFIAGNEVVTCCEDDKQFLGFLCKYDKADLLREGNYYKVLGEIKYEFAPEYEMEGPVIYVKKTTSLPTLNNKKKK